MRNSSRHKTIGLQDTNLARVRATQRYLMKCDNIFIVAKISRAITDQSLKASLYSILARHAPVEWEESGGKSLNLAVVCTKSEVSRQPCHAKPRILTRDQDINQKTARREFCGTSSSLLFPYSDTFRSFHSPFNVSRVFRH